MINQNVVTYTVEVQADTLGQLLGTLAVRIPSLGELIAADRLHSSIVANLNGDRFVSDPGTPLGTQNFIITAAGDMVTLAFFSLIPLLVPVAFLFLHLGVAMIQTYIFVLLATAYLSGAVAEAH